MSTHPYAGKSAPKELLIDGGRLEAAFYEGKPDPFPLLRPSANTGATGESLGRFLWAKTLTRFLDPQSESHWRCWPQTVSRHIFNEMTASRQRRSFRTPFLGTTGVGRRGLADGIVVTPSHNPPTDGGFKY